jgi:lysophospholipase L1-like esterase
MTNHSAQSDKIARGSTSRFKYYRTQSAAVAVGWPMKQQRRADANTTLIAAVGDSLTAGVAASGVEKTYPRQLELLLGSEYSVTNLGSAGATVSRELTRTPGMGPYWGRPQFQLLTGSRWHVVLLMLGTNDAIRGEWPATQCDPVSRTDAELLSDCPFVRDYMSLLLQVKGVGVHEHEPPDVWVVTPPPVLANGGKSSAPPVRLRQSATAAHVVNTVLPLLLPRLPRLSRHALGMHVSHVPGTFYALGGNHTQAKCQQSWGGCSPCSDGERRACKFYCDRAYCDMMHLNDAGYRELANAVGDSVHARAWRGHELGRGRWTGG